MYIASNLLEGTYVLMLGAQRRAAESTPLDNVYLLPKLKAILLNGV